MWGTHKEFNEEARCNGLEEQEWNEIAAAELKDALRKTQKWKSPGIDKVPNFWLNAFDSIHDRITNCLNKVMTRSNETNIPKDYRPITCLPTM